MQEHLGVNRNLARVHVEGGATDASGGEREAAQNFVEDEEPQQQDPGAWTGRIVQQLSGVWGYAVIGSAFNLALVAGLSSLEWTNWGGDGVEATNGAASSTASEVEPQGVPKYNKWTMGVYISVTSSVLASLRTTFAVAADDPKPLPGDEWCGWKYAPHCFISMLISTLFVAAFFYTLPVSLGAQVHYYFADAVPFLLQMTVCVVFTAQVMKFFYRRDQQRGGGATMPEQPQNEVRDHNGEEEKDFGCFKETVAQLNMILIGAVALGCSFFFCAILYPAATW